MRPPIKPITISFGALGEGLLPAANKSLRSAVSETRWPSCSPQEGCTLPCISGGIATASANIDEAVQQISRRSVRVRRIFVCKEVPVTTQSRVHLNHTLCLLRPVYPGSCAQEPPLIAEGLGPGSALTIPGRTWRH